MAEASIAPGAGGKAGSVAFVGRPNAGKSTLMNRLLQEKVAIVSDKPQTTRHRLIGILSGARGQIVFYDTPGLHRPLHRLNRAMVQHATDALNDADIVCLMVDASQPFGKGDAYVLDLVQRSQGPRICLLNKVEQVKKHKLLPLIERYSAAGFSEVVPISALTGDGCDIVLDLLWKMLPAGEPLYDPELLTVHPERFLVTERIREKVLEQTREELPYTSAVALDQWEEDPPREDGSPGLLRLYATILVERPNHKGIVVGKGGSRIKSIGTAARLDLEEFLERKVFLDLQVRHEGGWREDRRRLAELDRDVYGTT